MTEEVQNAIIVDERTGEEIPRGAKEINTLQVQLNINLVGTLEIDENAEQVFAEPLKDEDVRIRPDGLVYLPWTWYADRLNKGIGRLKWGLIPQGSPQSKETGKNNVLVVWGFWLVIKGIPVGFAMGETSYRTDNYTMSYGDAMEGAKSNALARNCKILGMAMELWNPEWVHAWVKNYAEQYEDSKGNKKWRKRALKPAATKTPDARKGTQEAPEATETVKPSNGAAAEAETLSAGFTGNQILAKTDLVKQLTALTGKETVEVCKFLGTLEKGKKFTLGQIAKQIKGEAEFQTQTSFPKGE